METDTIRRIVFAVIAVVLGFILSYIIGRRSGFNQATREDSVRVDTLLVFDTITQYEPILEERIVLQKVLVPITDTLWRRDTMYVYLEKEQVMWQDSLSRVYASGIMPQIDSVQHFVTERIVTRELTKVVKKPCRWGLGIHAGYGIEFSDPVRTAPYVGVGISYNLLSW